MFLAQIELIGFKSFPRRTKIGFHPGLTGIVGPNGCGKSNIVDAVRWVMGEQKESVLRSERMEQVIFNGTNLRKPLGMAEVNLTIENNLGLLPVEYTSVTVSRRLFRNGESEYLLNRNKTRLKDITDLFLDTGLGAGSYGIIEPGLVQKILNGSPEEQRVLFEEAAGIAKYKLRVKTAQKRLEGVNSNLERLTDILTEVERNVKSLKKQYNQARAYEKIRQELENLESLLLALDRNELKIQLTAIQNKLMNFQREIARFEQIKANLEAELEGLLIKISRQEDEIERSRYEGEGLQSENLKAENRMLLMEEKERNLISEMERNLNEIERGKQRIIYLDERWAILNSTFTRLTGESKTANANLQKSNEAYLNTQENWKSFNTELEEIKRRINQEQGNLSHQQKEGFYRKIKLDAIEERKLHLQKEMEEIGSQLTAIAGNRISSEEAKSSLLANITEIQKKIETLENDIGDLKAKIADKEKEQSGLAVELERHNSELKFLQSLIDRGQDLPSGVNFLLSQKMESVIETLANLLEVRPEYSLAVEAALGEVGNAVVVGSVEQALEMIELLRSQGKGPAKILPLKKNLSTSNAAQSIPAGSLGTANSFVECESQYGNMVNYLLGEVLLVEDWETAVKIHNRGQWNGLITTLKGETIGDLLYSVSGTEAKFPLIGRKKQAEKVKRSGEKIASRLEQIENEIQNLRQKLSASEANLDKLNSRRRELEGKNEGLIRNLTLLEAQNSNLEKRNSEILKEISLSDSQADTIQSELKEYNQKAEEFTQNISQLSVKLKEKEKTFEHLSQEVNDRRDEFHNQQLKNTSLSGEIDKISSEMALGKSRSLEQAEEIKRLMTASEQIKVKLRELSEERIHTQKSIEGYKQQLSDWKERHSKLASESSELKSERVELERKLKADSAEIERVRGEASKLEVETAELRLHIKAKGDTAREKFGLDLDTLTPPPVSEKGILEQNGGKLKRKLQAIGAVNLLALEEYGIQRERFNFLQSEYEDIIKSKEELLETITRTNAEARARFKDVFDRVSEYFSLLFKDLFEGGEGKLSLSGGDPLEAEIQLQANPAGKKLGTLEQMSGGEKTMTALAFLFSLYQVKPSPFCILDEVDAPLDDANVKRFLKLIQRFTPQTQFILVTHNKLTMEACDYLYGVTMEEEGISKIISVKMET